MPSSLLGKLVTSLLVTSTETKLPGAAWIIVHKFYFFRRRSLAFCVHSVYRDCRL